MRPRYKIVAGILASEAGLTRVRVDRPMAAPPGEADRHSRVA